MEDASGTDAVTPRAAAPMVAVPLAGHALLARSSGFGGTMPGMTAKVALRGRNQEAYRRWIANRDDCITAHGFCHVQPFRSRAAREPRGACHVVRPAQAALHVLERCDARELQQHLQQQLCSTYSRASHHRSVACRATHLLDRAAHLTRSSEYVCVLGPY